ncbi:hypothetical protein [Streptomyces sp. AD55]|uniref:hypothetical protein n=1 Tax=Streptomyces sp. AD55 TaxID=3242895 RepID=UPI00352721F0
MAKTTTSARKTTTKAKSTAAKNATTPTRKPRAKKPAPKPTTVDLRKPLPTRPRPIIGPIGVHKQATARAILASATAQLPIPHLTWNGPTAHLTDGTLLTHTPTHATTNQPPTFTAHVPCPHGAIHPYLIRSAQDLAAARATTATCETPHSGMNTDQALREGITPTTPPKTPPVLALREGIRRAHEDTQPLSTDEITAGLTARADNEEPKEHPDHA